MVLSCPVVWLMTIDDCTLELSEYPPNKAIGHRHLEYAFRSQDISEWLQYNKIHSDISFINSDKLRFSLLYRATDIDLPQTHEPYNTESSATLGISLQNFLTRCPSILIRSSSIFLTGRHCWKSVPMTRNGLCGPAWTNLRKQSHSSFAYCAPSSIKIRSHWCSTGNDVNAVLSSRSKLRWLSVPCNVSTRIPLTPSMCANWNLIFSIENSSWQTINTFASLQARTAHSNNTDVIPLPVLPSTCKKRTLAPWVSSSVCT